MTARTHPFRRQASASAFQEIAVFWLLRGFTYVILGFGVIIFSIIIYKGSPAVFGSFRVDGNAPFIHNDFLFTKPQTLHVFKYKGELKQMSADEFYGFAGQTPDASATPAPAATTTSVPTPTAVPATPAPVLSSTGIDPSLGGSTYSTGTPASNNYVYAPPKLTQ